jgi:hypothetical protein
MEWRVFAGACDRANERFGRFGSMNINQRNHSLFGMDRQHRLADNDFHDLLRIQRGTDGACQIIEDGKFLDRLAEPFILFLKILGFGFDD